MNDRSYRQPERSYMSDRSYVSGGRGRSRDILGDDSILTGGADDAAYQVFQYVHSRARSAQRKKDKRNKKLSMSPSRQPTRRLQSLEEGSLKTWRDHEKEQDTIKPTGKTPTRHLSMESHHSDSDAMMVRMTPDFRAYAESKYVKQESPQKQSEKRSPSPTSYKPYTDDPEDPSATEEELDESQMQDVEGVGVSAEGQSSNSFLGLETPSLKSQQRKLWGILVCILLAVGVVGLVFSLAERYGTSNPTSSEAANVTTAPPPTTLQPTPALQLTESPTTKSPQTLEPTKEKINEAETTGNTEEIPVTEKIVAAEETATEAPASEKIDSTTEAPVSHYHHLPFPPADEGALDLFCDNEKLEADGYEECERLCKIAECCWSDDPEKVCEDSQEIANLCIPYSEHCTILTTINK